MKYDNLKNFGNWILINFKENLALVFKDLLKALEDFSLKIKLYKNILKQI